MKAGSRILVVDDSQDIVNMLRVALARHGFEIDTTTSPEEALSMAAGRSYDAALLDLVMPGRDGAALAQALRDKNPGLPVALHDRSDAQYRRVLASAASPVRNASLLRMAERARRSGELGQAVEWWREAAEHGDWLGLRNLAIHHEHRSRDLEAALGLVEQALSGGEPRPPNWKAAADLRRRRERLKRKLGKRPAEG